MYKEKRPARPGEQGKYERLVHGFTVFVVIVSLAWSILPMLLLRENYVFTIHDGLDSYAGLVQMIHERHLFFHLSGTLPIMNNMERMYASLTFTLYDALNCLLGYLPAQICTRIIGALLGFFSMRHLLNTLFKDLDGLQKNIMTLAAVAYAITPVAPNRMIGFASLPMVIELFLYLRKTNEKLSKWVLLGLLIPVLSSFSPILVFLIGFWFVFMVADDIARKKFNCNLWAAFGLMCISTVFVNYSYFELALHAEETNRGLGIEGTGTFDFKAFIEYLTIGQYHATGMQKWFLLPALWIGTFCVLYRYIQNRKRKTKDKKVNACLCVLACGWFLWLFSALALVCRDAGIRSGILVIDGFNWGRIIGLMRIVWYLMLASIVWAMAGKKFLQAFLYGMLCLQLIYVAVGREVYNDVRYSMVNLLLDGTNVSFQEFFSPELFEEIKQDIHYNDEGVVAYGYHPAVLLYNNFCTVDGYFSVHSMKWQNEFREIIAPDLERNEADRQYYDEWGGRMYLYGPLSYDATKEKDDAPADCYINVDALRKYGGRYILSRAPIANADELGLHFVNDYDREDSLYHIFLYSTE